MNKSSRIITLTTDFGISDVYVGVMKGVILNINPNVQIVDITHAISPQNIHEAAFTINSAYRYFPKGTIHVIVVDPGVGSDRQAMVCKTDNAFFVCPNNGVLSYLLQDIETEETCTVDAVLIESLDYLLPHISNTFHGRDIFAPVAAHLSLGVPVAEIGAPIQDLVRFLVPAIHISEGTLTGQIINVDSFGNLITNISENALAAFLLSSASNENEVGQLDKQTVSAKFEIMAGNTCVKKLNGAYAESGAGEPLAIIGSFGLLEIAINLGNAEARLGLKNGNSVMVRRFD
jgi:S-adenosylmethionine hydrolase